MSVSCDMSSLLISYILAHSFLVSLGEVVVVKLALRDLFTGVFSGRVSREITGRL